MPIHRHSNGSEMNLEPNLTPLLDLVFQLITFFMLVINFKGAALDLSLKLPVLGSARPVEWKKGTEPIVLNVRSDGIVQVYGEVIDPAEFFPALALKAA
ncbi:MAG: biopolymer transporter ExbD, partial [Planctomyces sp.]|nr:biopolymer transporter ExbD [Planctomyces sp.]